MYIVKRHINQNTNLCSLFIQYYFACILLFIHTL